MSEVPGTHGYAAIIDAFFAIDDQLDFNVMHACLLPLLPDAPARVLDIGAGTGRDAAALAMQGFDVTAVEPTRAFLIRARALHADLAIEWHCDALPDLTRLSDRASFQFVLVHGVWQHIDDAARESAMRRIAALTSPGGIFTVALRHGPPGAGTYYFDANATHTIQLAERCGFGCVLHLPDQPSALPDKTHVTWTRLAFRRKERASVEYASA